MGVKGNHVSIPFRADTGFERILNRGLTTLGFQVSIPFRADTGFELREIARVREREKCFNPFQG